MVRHVGIGVVAFALACVDLNEPGVLVPPTADEDPDLPQIDLEVAGHTRAVHLETHGEPGQPVILVLHGSLSDFRSMRLFEALSDRYFVVEWDQRGNGLSERISASEYTWDSIVDEIDAIRMRFSPSTPVTLLGHSFGAMYATLYMSRHPGRVSQAVLLEPAGLTGDIMAETFDDFFVLDLFEGDLNRLYWQNQVLSPSDHATMDYKALALLLSGKQTRYWCGDGPSDVRVWRPGAYVDYVRGVRMHSPNFEYDFTVGLDRFHSQVLLLGSECSALGYDFQRRWHWDVFPNVRVERVAGAGHVMQVDQPEAVLAAVRGYLEAYR